MTTARIRVVFLWLAAIVIAAPTFAQAKFHYRQGGQLEGVFFLDAQTGWTAEDGSRIRRSTDAGLTWTAADVDERVRGELRGILVRGTLGLDLEGWACGDDGTILRVADDEGLVWDWINDTDPILDGNGELAELWDVFMIDSDTGWAVGNDGAISKTGNGWLTWSFPSGCTLPDELSAGIDGDLPDIYEIAFFNAQDGIMVSDYGNAYLTHDGGCTWTVVNVVTSAAQNGVGVCPVRSNKNFELWDIAFEDPNDPDTRMWIGAGIGTNDGFLFYSPPNSGGEVWTSTHCFNADFAGCGIPTVYAVANLGGTSGPTAFSACYGSWVLAWEEGTANYDLCSCMSGEPTECEESLIWNQRSVFDPDNANPPLSAAAALGSTKGCIVGRFGIIRLFEPGGMTEFEDVGTTVWSRIGDGDFIDDTTGCIITQGHVIRRTTDAGATWVPIEVAGVSPSTNPNALLGLSLDFGTSGVKGVAGGTHGFVAYSGDGGEHWTKVTPVSGFTGNALAIDFAENSDTVYFTAPQGAVFRSTNAGVNWSACTSLPSTMRAVSFAEPQGGDEVGFVAGDSSPQGTIFITEDAGVTWEPVEIQGLQPLSIRDIATWGNGQNAFAVAAGGRVYQRRNGGDFYPVTVDLSPDPSPTADLADVEVLVDGTAVSVQIVGAGGLVLFRDSAGNWSAPKSQTSDELIRASFQSPDHGFVLGPQFLVCEYTE